MPVYAYACKDCGHAFDIRQSFSDDALTVCPECGGVLRKKFNSVGVVFKGSGFYRTDSRTGGGAGPPPGLPRDVSAFFVRVARRFSPLPYVVLGRHTRRPRAARGSGSAPLAYPPACTHMASAPPPAPPTPTGA